MCFFHIALLSAWPHSLPVSSDATTTLLLPRVVEEFVFDTNPNLQHFAYVTHYLGMSPASPLNILEATCENKNHALKRLLWKSEIPVSVL
jgi:hypothetical protein